VTLNRFIEVVPGSLTLVHGQPGAIEPGWARIRVDACGICGTDLHVVEGMQLQPGVSYPLRPGHEVAGIVTELAIDSDGSERDDTITVGAAVALHPLLPCGVCRFCRSGAENRCTDAQILGFHRSGGMADEVLWPIDRLVGVDGIALEQAALLPDAVATAYHAFQAARPPSGGGLCVIGAGGVGTHLLQIAAAMDPTLRLAAVVRSEATATRLRESGVIAIIGFEGASRAAREALGTVDVAIDFSGASMAPRVGARMLGSGGRLVLGSVDDSPLDLGMTITTAMTRELEILGTYSSTIDDLRASAELVRSGAIDLSMSASLQFGLDDVPAALRAVSDRPNGLVRAVIRP
jgi:2-desacetyl-2-hydroxyethyl bacteriochlorophyllide A dehydrogenase